MSKQRTRKILLHLLYWIFIFVFYTIANGFQYGNFGKSVIRELSTLPTRMLAVYFVLYYLIPRFVGTHKYVEFVVFSFLTILLTGLLQRIVFHTVWYPIFMLHDGASPLWRIWSIMDETFSVVTAMFFPLSYKLTEYWQKERRQTELLAKQKIEAELTALKNQINPHFLFNTLNNLYGLALKGSDKVPFIILKLSDMLSYLLYDSVAEKVELKKEIALIDNYLELQRIRFGNDLNIRYTKKGNPDELRVAPILFLPFVENAFKHGVSQQTSDGWLDISFEIANDKVLFSVENMIVSPENNQKSNKTGIGLRNSKERLALLYPENHILKVLKNGSFRVELVIDLSTSNKGSENVAI